MHQLAIFMAKVMPEEVLLNQLEETIQKYKSSDVEEKEKHKNALGMLCVLISTRFSTEGKEAMDVIKDVDEAMKHHDLFKNRDQ